MGSGAKRNMPGIDDEDEYDYCWNCGDNDYYEENCNDDYGLIEWDDIILRQYPSLLGGSEYICSNCDCGSIGRSVGFGQLTNSFNQNLWITNVTPGRDINPNAVVSNAIVTMK
ncbi:hypothetical protein Scep_012170 [Stephania cephalantha]|uniref:Uncharacterized protein n=1 Tax=Stephania cephalantha TaxID=152367 RepID=A0AAP0JF25_9MAGN